MLKKYQKILIISALSVMLFSLTVDFAHAELANKLLTFTPVGALVDVSLIVIGKTLSFLLLTLGFLGGISVFLGGTLTNWALDLNSTVLQNPTVAAGWIVTRDLANLGFVLAIILIAFATILRIENYSMKKTLVKLIAVAILINFSLVFAGIFLDFSGMLTDFFLNKATSYNPLQLGEKLAGSFQVQKLLEVKKDAGAIDQIVAGLANNINSMMSFIASLFFVVLFTGIAAITLIGLAAVLFIRYIALTILLILMPLAWLFWIWPDTEHLWKQWWNEFLKWTFFAPSASFFIYLAFRIAVKEKGLAIDTAGQLINPGNALALTIENIGGIIGQMISIIGILIGGIIVSEKAAGKLSPAIMGAAMGFKNAILGGAAKFTGTLATRWGTAPLRTEGGKNLIQGIQTAGQGKWWAPVGRPIRTLGNYLAEAPRMENKIIDQYKKDFGEYSTDDLKNRIHGVATDEQRVAIMEILSEKDALTGDHQQYAPLLKKYGRKGVNNPAWDPDIIQAAKSGNTEELNKKIGEKLSGLSSSTFGKINWSGNITEDEKESLRGTIDSNTWKTIINGIIEQIARGVIKGEHVGKIYAQLDNAHDIESFHQKLMEKINAETLINTNPGLYHFYQGNMAKHLGVMLPEIKTLKPQQQSSTTPVSGLELKIPPKK